MKAAILGTENSHAFAFAKYIKEDPVFSDIELIGVYGYDDMANGRLLKAGLAPYAAKSPDEFLGKADAVLVTARHGEHHYEYALPYIKQGCAAFIDKPFTVELAHAQEMIDCAQQSGALLCGGSSLKFLSGLQPLREFAESNKLLGGYAGAPIDMVNPYAGFFFYSQHLVEMMFTVFGSGVKAVTAYCPDDTKKRVSVIFDYGEFDVMGQYTSSHAYTVSVYAEKETRSIYTHDLGDCFRQELLEFRQMVLSGKPPHEYEELIKPVKVLNAIHKSYTDGVKIAVQND
ncbi:MAG: Gfo/Idh/MocA family oxidoreductase [Clostridia bacterium]|nr:Gfo/Idh/MocA family oxidoreductase [Clostridia bacterium]